MPEPPKKDDQFDKLWEDLGPLGRIIFGGMGLIICGYLVYMIFSNIAPN